MSTPQTLVVRTFTDRAEGLSHFILRAGEAPRLIAFDDALGCPVESALAALEWTGAVGILTDDDLLHARSQIVLVSRVAGIEPPVDGVTQAIDDPELLRRDCHRSRQLGFAAKLCIHPSQVDIVNACFAPTPDEVAWAGRVVAAFERAHGNAVQVDGRMVDRPVLLKAQAILREAGAA